MSVRLKLLLVLLAVLGSMSLSRADVARSDSTTTRALWVWSDEVTDPQARQTLVQRSARSGVNALYLSVYQSTPNSAGRKMYEDSALANLILQAHLNKIQVWAAYSDPDWADPGKSAWPGTDCNSESFSLKRMAEVISYNGANPSAKFDGVVLDVEGPAGTTPDFVALLTLYQCVRNTLEPAGLNLAVSIGSFWHAHVQFPAGGPDKPAYQHIIDLDLTQVVVQDYRDFAGPADCTLDGIICIAQDEIAYADSLGKAGFIVVGVETNDCMSTGECTYEKETFFEEGQVVLNTEAQLVAQEFGRHVSFGGFAIHYYKHAYLQGTAAWPEVNPSFPGVSPPLDLIFVIDTTNSMWDDIDAVKVSATDIVNSIDSRVTDYRIALVDYKDFPVWPYGNPGDYPAGTRLAFTIDKTAMVNAINALAVGGGADEPESVYSALVHAILDPSVGGWRVGVSKQIILMGDAPPHDPEPFTGYTGQSVVDAANSVDPAIIQAIVIGGDPEAQSYFSGLASSTGGHTFAAATAQDVVAAIMEAIGVIVEPPVLLPTCKTAVPSPGLLWPANNKFATVRIQGIENADSIVITSVFQDEPTGKDVDAQGLGAGFTQLRAQRDGKGDGRVYHISFTATGPGGSCNGVVKVIVPHDMGVGQRQRGTAGDGGPLYDSTVR